MALALRNLEPLSTFGSQKRKRVHLHALAEVDLPTEWIYVKNK